MWYDDPFVKLKKRKRNRNRKGHREPILMVNARMMEQRRKRMSRLGTILLCLGAFAGLAWLVFQGGRWMGRVLFTENPAYTVRRFDIASDGRRIPAHLIREYASLDEGMNLFAVSLAQVRDQLTQVPLIRRVDVQRILPDTLKIRVTERVAIAGLGPATGSYPLAVDRYGYVMGRRSGPARLPQITGIDIQRFRPGVKVDDPSVLDAVEVLDLCDSDPRFAPILQVQAIDVERPNDLVVTLDQGRVAELGRENLMSHLIQLARTVQYSDDNRLGWTHGNFTVLEHPAIK
jgi:cell division septal protein FtsQ